ncbi:caspase domain-containing protein [Mycena capillaripes]|nr:caspase domain-containing protein [Mycena capillaripes]
MQESTVEYNSKSNRTWCTEHGSLDKIAQDSILGALEAQWLSLLADVCAGCVSQSRATKDAKDAKADPQKQHKPLEEEEPCTPKRRALLIGISYSGADTRVKEDGYGELRGPHADVAAMRRLLVGRYGYKEEDVVVLLDGEEGGTLQPTRVNILQAIDDLVRDARKGDRFFFHLLQTAATQPKSKTAQQRGGRYG